MNTKSVYQNQNDDISRIFESAESYRKILCVPMDFAKRKHVALICDGHGEILKKSFPVHNSQEGVEFFAEQIERSASRRKIPQANIFVGGEDLPPYVENFLFGLASRGYFVVRVNALEAKHARENMVASTDSLDLLGIAKTMLSKRAVTVAKTSGSTSSIIGDANSKNVVYRDIRELSRSRARLVKSKTATSNQIHTYVDRLFPGFLDASKSGITPFTKASLALMKNEFSTLKIARKKPVPFAGQLRQWGTRDPDETATKLITLAKSALDPDPTLMGVRQQVLVPLVEQCESLNKACKGLKIEAAIHLSSTPYAFLTSIPGVALTIACGVAGELGDPARLPAVSSMCAYGGIVPRLEQTGGPEGVAKVGGTSPRCNRVFKHWVMQSAEKTNLYGDAEWKDRAARWIANGQHVRFATGRRFLRLTKALVTRQTTYQRAVARDPDATPAQRAEDAEIAFSIMVKKWKEVPNWQEVAFGKDKPLGMWRQLMIGLYDANLPLKMRS